MVKTRLTQQEVEDIRVATLVYLNRERIDVVELARRVNGLHYYAAIKFLEGRRPSPAVAAAIACALPIGLVYRPPQIIRID